MIIFSRTRVQIVKEDKMARVEPKNGKHKLGDSRDTDLEDIDDKKYDVFTDDEKLAAARRDFPGYTWFASFTIKDKQGNVVRELSEYTIKFDDIDSGDFKLYYYLDQAANPLPYEKENKDGKKKVKAKLRIGDPPIGTVP
jgi:hypothetical protein